MACYRTQRAGVCVNHGRALAQVDPPKPGKGGGRSEQFRGSLPFFDEASREVQATRKLVEALAPERIAALDFADFLVQVAFGDVESMRDDYLGALRRYEEAERLLNQAARGSEASLIAPQRPMLAPEVERHPTEAEAHPGGARTLRGYPKSKMPDGQWFMLYQSKLMGLG